MCVFILDFNPIYEWATNNRIIYLVLQVGRIFMLKEYAPLYQILYVVTRGGILKKNAPSGGRREKCWGISCEKSRF
jgi:hypothetical protein